MTACDDLARARVDRSNLDKRNGNTNLSVIPVKKEQKCESVPSGALSLSLTRPLNRLRRLLSGFQTCAGGALCARGPFRRPCRPSRLATRVIPHTIQPTTRTTRPCHNLCRFSLAGTSLARANARAARTRAAQQRSCAHIHRCCACIARTGEEEGGNVQSWVDCESLCLAMCPMSAWISVCLLLCAPICAIERAQRARMCSVVVCHHLIVMGCEGGAHACAAVELLHVSCCGLQWRAACAQVGPFAKLCGSHAAVQPLS